MEKNEKKPTIIVQGKRIEVEQDVYKAYYQHYERERYLDGWHKDNCESIEFLDEIGCPAKKHCQSAEDDYIQTDKVEKLYLAIERLDLQEKQIVELYFFENCTQLEIAIILNRTQNYVYYQVHKILKLLHEYLTQNNNS